MSGSKPVDSPTPALVRKLNIPVQMTDLAVFDDSFAFMKEKFTEEMKRVEEQMFQLGKAMSQFYNQTLTVQTGLTSKSNESIVDWDTITSSPLVEGDGSEKTLKLQFDLSQFEPGEITVLITDDVLSVSALHEEKDDNYNSYREYSREFMLPRGTDPNSVISSLSRDGILTVTAPLVHPVAHMDPTPIRIA